MKICISSTGKDLAAAVDPRFGRAQKYVIVDTDTKAFEGIDNPAAMAGGGAGTRAAQLVIDKGIEPAMNIINQRSAPEPQHERNNEKQL